MAAYDAAISVATAPEQERLRDLRLRLNIPADSPEWQFYAVLGGGTDKARPTSDAAQLIERIEALVRRNGQMPDNPFASITRYAFAAGVGVCELLFAAISYRLMPPVFDRIGMFVLGLSTTAGILLFLAVAPIIGSRTLK